MATQKGSLSHLAEPGAEIAVRVTPRASCNALRVEDGVVHVRVSCAPEGGKANREVAKLLARALGVPKTRLDLVRGAASRDKLFRLS